MKHFYESGKLDASWVEDYCHGDWNACARYQMEERGQFHPDNMLPDGMLDDSLAA